MHANVPSKCRSSLLSTILLPDNHWHVIEHGDEVHLCEIRKTSNGTSTLTSSVTIYPDNVWKVFIHDNKVPAKCPILAIFPDNILLSQVSALVDTMHSAVKCPGNPEEKFVNICKKRGGEVRGERGHGYVIASIDNHEVIDVQGETYPCTLRRNDCDILCERERCNPSNGNRNSLRSTLSKQQCEDYTSSSSHTTYSNLTSTEKNARQKNLHDSLKVASRKLSTLEGKVSTIIETQSIHLEGNDHSDISSLISDVTPMVEEKFPPNTPQRMFWEQ